jgi:hypothetical protein
MKCDPNEKPRDHRSRLARRRVAEPQILRCQTQDRSALAARPRGSHPPRPAAAMRRERDAYMTPNGERAIAALLSRVEVNGSVLEPCAGDGSLVEPLRRWGYAVRTNDIRGGNDARTWAFPQVSWVITNPPFSDAQAIIENALKRVGVGVACILRLSFLEPTFDRLSFFAAHPPTGLIVLPRMSFTGDKRTDSVTCAWVVWQKQPCDQTLAIATGAKIATRRLVHV